MRTLYRRGAAKSRRVGLGLRSGYSLTKGRQSGNSPIRTDQGNEQGTGQGQGQIERVILGLGLGLELGLVLMASAELSSAIFADISSGDASHNMRTFG